MKTVLLLVLAFTSAFAGCVPVAGDRIIGSDLALADSRLGAVPASLVIAPAPVPGSQRVLAAADVRRLAQANGIRLADASELCFEVRVHKLSVQEVSDAMRVALPVSVEVTIVERPSRDVPFGDLIFPLQGLSPAGVAEGIPQLWRGFVRYARTRRVEVTARVRLTQQMTAVVLADDVAEGQVIGANLLRLKSWSGPVQRFPVALHVSDVLGHVSTRNLKAGGLIPLALLERPAIVHRGDEVAVEVVSGAARVRMSAFAERSGKDGEMIHFRNPVNGRIFQARLEGGKAVVVVAPTGGLR